MADLEDVGLHGDILEQILARSDVDDLIRCTAVCKSWLSLISNPLFIKTHLMHSYNKDRKNNETRRIIMEWFPLEYINLIFLYTVYPPDVRCFILGSSNGLVCLLTMDAKQILVANPSIRQVRHKLPMPPIIARDATLVYAGFGYDFVTDDYKVILGDYTCFQVLSLKSGVWKVIQVEYKFSSRVGVLCNGSLHWFMRDHNDKIVIVSFDLSKEEFKEIPQPDDSRYQWNSYHQLGIRNECLSIITRYNGTGPEEIWVMNNYNAKQSWEMLPHNCEVKCQVIHSLYEPYEQKNVNISCENDKSFGQKILRTNSYTYICDSLFVQSLVSPHLTSNQ